MARHGSLADQLLALMAYRDRPTGVADDMPTAANDNVQMRTNWRAAPPAETNPEDLAGLRIERRLEIAPSLDRIEREIAEVNVDELGNPSGDKVERDAAGRVIRIGGLSFSDGTQTEKAFKRAIDGAVVQFDYCLPLGAMLGTKEAQTVASGGGSRTQHGQSNGYYAVALKTAPTRHIVGGRMRGGKSFTQAESRAMLDAAWANTVPGSYRFTRCPDGLPCASNRVADSFLSMAKTTCAKGGAIGWEDIADSMEQREIWLKAERGLADEDRQVLDAAMTASSFADLGGAGSRRAAERRGRKALLAANDNLLAALAKAAA